MGNSPLFDDPRMNRLVALWCVGLVCGLMSLWLSVSLAHADEGDQGDATANFLKIDPSARSTAMGSAYSASPDGANTAYHNPAGLSELKSTRASLTHLDIFQGITYQDVSLVGGMGESSGWGLSYQGIDFGEQNRTEVGSGGSNDPQTGLGDFSADDLSVNVSTATRLTDAWSVGGTVKYVNKQIAGFDDSTWSADLGTQYQLAETLRVGARVRNVFGELALDEVGDPLPRSVDVGINWRKHMGQHRIVLRSRVSVPDDADEFISYGAEWGVWNTLYLRAGYNGNPEAGDGLTLGGGLEVTRFKLDYALEDLGELGDHSKFSIEYRF